MNELREWLKDGDPIAHEPSLSPADVGHMRRAIVAAEASDRSSLADWARGSWAAATVIVALTIAVSMSRWVTPWSHLADADVGDANVDAALTLALPEPSARRQVQLIAPGGTRVIWIFNDDFKP